MKSGILQLELSLLRKKVAAQGPLQFGMIYLPHYMTNKPPSFHLEIQEDLNETLCAYAAPREHAKSTFIDTIVTLYELYFEKFRYQIYIGDTSTNAESNLLGITQEIEENELLNHDFGSLKPEMPIKWTDQQIITTTDRKIEAIGVGMKIRGRKHRQYRPDRLIFDDIENDENVATKEQRDKLEKWFFKAALNAREKRNGKVRVIGTILDYDSLLANLMNKKRNPLWRTRLYKAVNYDAAGKPYSLWPDRWPLEELAAKKAEIGSVNFDQEYQNEPVSDASSIVKRDWIRMHKGYTPETAASMKKLIRVDPAAKRGDKNDEFALVVLGMDADSMMYVLDMYHDKISFR